jgi:hypothetical protein
MAKRFKIEVVSSVSDIVEIFGSLSENSVRKVRSEELTASEVKTLNLGFVANSYACWIPATRENLEALAGLKICGEGEHPLFTVGGVGYRMQKNTKNRPLGLSRVSPVTKSIPVPTYSNSMARGLWGAGAGILMFRDDSEVASAQHTITGAIVALDAGNSLEGLFFLCIFGLPPQFSDWMDKGRSRTKIQDSFGDSNLFPKELISEFQLELTPDGKDSERERIAFLKLHSKIAESVILRTKGSDISPTGGKLGWESESRFMDRFFDGRETLQKLTVKLWESGKSQGGKQDRTWLKLFNPAIVGTALILASNDEETLQKVLSDEVVRKEGETPEEYAERRIQTLAVLRGEDSLIRLDWDFVDTVLNLLESSTDNSGELSPVFSNLFEKVSSDKKDSENKKYIYAPLSVSSMSAMVELLKNIRKGDYTSSVWTSYRKIEGKIPPSYRNFGGIDVGYINTRKGKEKSE